MTRAKTALITGITGQDGSWLAERLLADGYSVHGWVRQLSTVPQSRIAHLVQTPGLALHEGRLDDVDQLASLVERHGVQEIYHLAAQSSAALSLQEPASTCDSIAGGTTHLLELMRLHAPQARLFLAGSSEVFGRPAGGLQDESTPFRPVTPYGCAKAFATQLAGVYRSQFGVFVSVGILFNHESERRGRDFVTAKICRAAAAIRAGHEERVTLGSLDARRDWSDARDVVRGMWLALQQEAADDYVFASGVTHCVQDVVEVAFAEAGLDWRKHVVQAPGLVRTTDPVNMCGDASKAARVLGWRAETSFEELIRRMTRHELKTHGIA
jgi:GDPmannose 4,6-dehydratase